MSSGIDRGYPHDIIAPSVCCTGHSEINPFQHRTCNTRMGMGIVADMEWVWMGVLWLIREWLWMRS